MAKQWQLPPYSNAITRRQPVDDLWLRTKSDLIRREFDRLGLAITIEAVHIMSRTVNFELRPGHRVRVNSIMKVENDLQIALGGKASLIQNSKLLLRLPHPSPSVVNLHLPSNSAGTLLVNLGESVTGADILMDVASAPHILIAGSTGSGKSVCINSILTTLLLNNTPDQLTLVLIDPKRVELAAYRNIPHLCVDVIDDMNEAAHWLSKLVDTMEQRYSWLSKQGLRSVDELKSHHRMSRIVVVCDEMADLMLTNKNAVIDHIVRLAQKGRAAGIHLILATQRPTVKVVDGLIKANVPVRIAFAVNSGTDSRVILDQVGAQSLLGNGDMIIVSPGHKSIGQGTFVNDFTINQVCDYWREQANERSKNQWKFWKG